MLLPFGVVAVNNLDQDHSDNDDNDEEEEDGTFDPAERERICMEAMFTLHYRLDFSVKNIRIPFAQSSSSSSTKTSEDYLRSPVMVHLEHAALHTILDGARSSSSSALATRLFSPTTNCTISNNTTKSDRTSRSKTWSYHNITHTSPKTKIRRNLSIYMYNLLIYVYTWYVQYSLLFLLRTYFDVCYWIYFLVFLVFLLTTPSSFGVPFFLIYSTSFLVILYCWLFSTYSTCSIHSPSNQL